LSWDLADLAEAIAGSGSRRTLARQKPQKRKRRKRLANRECFDKPAQHVAILDVRVHIFCSGSCGLVYSKQLLAGKTNALKLLQRCGRGGIKNNPPQVVARTKIRSRFTRERVISKLL